MEKYSVLMTVFNNDRPEFFVISLDSMLNQTIKPDEVVIVKDGPINDDLQNVINQRLNRDVPIHQLQLEKNLGLGLALNEGLRICRNELVARMDSDDYSLPQRCQLELIEFSKNQKLDIIGCPVDEFTGDINNIVGCRLVPYTNGEIYKYAKKRDPFNHPTVMFKKSVVEKAGWYSNYRKNQDTDLWIKMLRNNAICMNLKEHVFRFRFGEDTYKKRKSWINTKILIEIRYKAWRNGFNSLFEFLQITFAQLIIFILPLKFQKYIYKHLLRKW